MKKVDATIHWLEGEVMAVTERRPGLQRLRIRCDDGEQADAVHYTDELPELVPGDRVLLNGTAIRKNLGTGGVHFVHAPLGREPLSKGLQTHRRQEGESGDPVGNNKTLSVRGNATGHDGHIMKLRYTPLQRAIMAAEEQSSPYHGLFTEERDLQGMPVVIGELHSMLPVFMSRLKHKRPEIAATYIMSDGAALPLAFSRHSHELIRLGWLNGTITFGNAYGGQLETVNVYTALLAAKHIFRSDTAVVTMGPGITGTGTVWGHTGMEVSQHLHAVHALGGVPVVIPRISFADPRSRHYGISHHTLTALGRASFAPAIVPLPSSLTSAERETVEEQLRTYDIGNKHRIVWLPSVPLEEIEAGFRLYESTVTTMGRGVREDGRFFAAVCAAADYVCRELSTDDGRQLVRQTNNAQA